MAGFGVLWRVLGMKAGQSKLKRVLGIVGIVAFVGFFIMRYEIFVEIINNPGDFIILFLNHPIETNMILRSSTLSLAVMAPDQIRIYDGLFCW